jgi:DNA-binding NtrC family response regulator
MTPDTKHIAESAINEPGAPRVLIVDDEKAESIVIEAILSESGFEVWTVPSGSDAAERLHARLPFDLVIIDMTMGAAHDSKGLRPMRNVLPGAAILLMTDNGTFRNVLQDIADGDFGIEYVKKPFSKDELLVSVRRALCRRQRKQQSDV